MFRFSKTLDIITLFHSPTVPSSAKALTLLNRASALAQSRNAKPGPQDLHPQQQQTTSAASASDVSHDIPAVTKPPGSVFELEVTIAPPTSDQLGNILDYLGTGNWVVAGKPSDIVAGARNREDAISKVRLEAGKLIRPLVVDWNNAKVVYGDNPSAILKMLEELPPE